MPYTNILVLRGPNYSVVDVKILMEQSIYLKQTSSLKSNFVIFKLKKAKQGRIDKTCNIY
uniref:Uncharacterized protein n=1 Tax=Rhizophora mucronata TaxID=61149 RepID=A0A2P2KBX7_RHIMU